MMVLRFGIGGRALLIILHLLHIWTDHTTLAQTTPDDTTIVTEDTTIIAGGGDENSTNMVTDNPGDISRPPKLDIKPELIEPNPIDASTVKFIFKSKEYLFVNIKVMHDFAESMCSTNYLGALAMAPNLELAKFLAIALSETNLEFESLWVGGKNTVNGNTTSWNWIKNNYTDAVSSDILGLIGNSNVTVDFERNCLAFAREDHDEPQFKSLNCLVERAFMCERAVGEGDQTKSTHRDWILIGDQFFKIFSDQVDYDTASINCVNVNENASLAVLKNMQDVRQLARYLLIGRPSLENAWIGARWAEDKYQFEADQSVILDNITKAIDQFPPWRNGSMQITGACLLLDRHLADNPLFIEARCQRLRPYICSRPAENVTGSTNFTTTIFENRKYLAFFDEQPWERARTICIDYKSQLVEPEDAQQVQELLFIMGQNVSTFSHIWLGGRYKDNAWTWVARNLPIPTESLPFIQNNTYIHNIEERNTCLNLDRENHILGLFYGTICFYPQHYICVLNADDQP